jgi:hypothetical protein
MIQVSHMHNSSNPKKAYECLNYLRLIGLNVAGVPAINKRLLFGGKYSFQYDGHPFTGQVDLYVGQGALRNDKIPARVKKLFKKEVRPAMAEVFPEVDQNYSGKIELHLSEGFLTAFNLTH